MDFQTSKSHASFDISDVRPLIEIQQEINPGLINLDLKLLRFVLRQIQVSKQFSPFL